MAIDQEVAKPIIEVGPSIIFGGKQGPQVKVWEDVDKSSRKWGFQLGGSWRTPGLTFYRSEGQKDGSVSRVPVGRLPSFNVVPALLTIGGSASNWTAKSILEGEDLAALGKGMVFGAPARKEENGPFGWQGVARGVLIEDLRAETRTEIRSGELRLGLQILGIHRIPDSEGGASGGGALLDMGLSRTWSDLTVRNAVLNLGRTMGLPDGVTEFEHFGGLSLQAIGNKEGLGVPALWGIEEAEARIRELRQSSFSFALVLGVLGLGMGYTSSGVSFRSLSEGHIKTMVSGPTMIGTGRMMPVELQDRSTGKANEVISFAGAVMPGIVLPGGTGIRVLT